MHQTTESWTPSCEEKLELFEAYLRGRTAAAQGDPPCSLDEDTPLERRTYEAGYTTKRVEVLLQRIEKPIGHR